MPKTKYIGKAPTREMLLTLTPGQEEAVNKAAVRAGMNRSRLAKRLLLEHVQKEHPELLAPEDRVAVPSQRRPNIEPKHNKRMLVAVTPEMLADMEAVCKARKLNRATFIRDLIQREINLHFAARECPNCHHVK